MMTLEFVHQSCQADNVSYHTVRQFNKNKHVGAIAVWVTTSVILKEAVC